MEKAYELSQKIIKDIENYTKQYTTNDGKIATTQQSLVILNMIVQDCCVLYKYIIEKKLYENMHNIIPALNQLGELIKKIQITKDNAEKLHLDSAIQIWQQIKIVGALLACMVIDNHDADK